MGLGRLGSTDGDAVAGEQDPADADGHVAAEGRLLARRARRAVGGARPGGILHQPGQVRRIEERYRGKGEPFTGLYRAAEWVAGRWAGANGKLLDP